MPTSDSLPTVEIAIIFVTVPGVALSMNRSRFPDVSATMVSAWQGRTKMSASRKLDRVRFFICLRLIVATTAPIDNDIPARPNAA
jgi:hypothetical protein